MTDKKNVVIKVKYSAAGKPGAAPVAKTITVWNVKRIMLAVFVLSAILAAAVYFLVGGDDRQETAQSVQAVVQPENITKPEAVVDEADKAGLLVKGPADAQGVKKALEPAKLKASPKASAAVKSKPVANKKTHANSSEDKQGARRQAQSNNKANLASLNKNVSRAMLAREINGKEPGQAMAGTVSVSKAEPVDAYYFTELKDMNGKKVYHEWLQNGKLIAKYEMPVAADRWRTYSHRVLAGRAGGQWQVRLTDESGLVLNEKTFTAK